MQLTSAKDMVSVVSGEGLVLPAVTISHLAQQLHQSWRHASLQALRQLLPSKTTMLRHQDSSVSVLARHLYGKTIWTMVKSLKRVLRLLIDPAAGITESQEVHVWTLLTMHDLRPSNNSFLLFIIPVTTTWLFKETPHRYRSRQLLMMRARDWECVVRDESMVSGCRDMNLSLMTIPIVVPAFCSLLLSFLPLYRSSDTLALASLS